MIRPLIAALLAAAAVPAAAQTIAITGGTVALGDGSEPIPGGVVIPDPVKKGAEGIGKVLRRIFRF